MPDLKNWDKYEVALLIDTYVNVKASTIGLDEALSDLSNKLRTMAEIDGFEVSDAFRNINGMHWQYGFIKLAFENIEFTTRKPSKLFIEMVDMYMNHRDEFATVLKEAKDKLNKTNMRSMGNKELFLEWVHKQNILISTNSFIDNIELVSDYAIRHNITKVSFWEIDNVKRYNEIRVRLSGDRIFKFTNKELFRFFEKNGKLYSDFLKAFYPQVHTDTSLVSKLEIKVSEHVDTTIVENAIKQSVTTVANQIITEYTLQETSATQRRAENVIGQEIKETQVPLQGFDGSFVYDFNNPVRLEFSTPLSVSYFDEIRDTSSWKKVYVGIVSLLYEDYQDTINNYKNSNLFGRGRSDLADYEHQSSMVSPRMVTNDLYLETNLSANDITVKIKKLLDICLVDYENVKIRYTRPDNREKIDEPVSKTVESKVVVREKPTKDDLDIKIETTIARHFSNGINPSNFVNLLRFKQFYSADHNEGLNISDDFLTKKILQLGVLMDGKVYIVSDECKDRLTTVVCGVVNDGYAIVYFENLFNQNEDWLVENNIYAADMLRSLLVSLAYYNETIGGLTIKQGYFSVEKSTELALIEGEIKKVWGENPTVRIDSLSERLPYIPFEKIKYDLSYASAFKRNSEGVYAYRRYFQISNDQIEALKQQIREVCEQNGRASFDELYLEKVFEDNYELTTSAIYDFLFDELSTEFDRKANILSPKGTCLDIEEQIKRFCKGRQTVTLQELGEVMNGVIGRVDLWRLIDYACNYMVRIDEENFVADNLVNFDITSTDCIIDEIVRFESIGLKQIVTYIRFPECRYQWNAFLLESFVRRFSESYKYMSLSNNSRNVGAIVKKNSVDDYHGIMAKALYHSTVSLSDENEVFDYLMDMGYLGRRSYKKIEELIMDVHKLRGEL